MYGDLATESGRPTKYPIRRRLNYPEVPIVPFVSPTDSATSEISILTAALDSDVNYFDNVC